MSDYFGALIRSSGLTIAGRTQAPPLPPQSASGIVEITEEREAPPAAALETGVADHREVNAASPVIETAARPSTIVPPRPATTPEARPETYLRPSATSPIEKPAGAPEMTASRPAAKTQPASFDPVRAAMQWVASDPDARLDHASPPSARRIGGPLLSPPQAGMDVEIEERVVVSEELATTSVDDTQLRPAAGRVAARAITPVSQSRERHIAPSPRRMREAAASVDEREETIEVSIGTINLHVDAPAPHTVAQAPPASRPRPAPEQRAERSGLARRYLRSL